MKVLVLRVALEDRDQLVARGIEGISAEYDLDAYAQHVVESFTELRTEKPDMHVTFDWIADQLIDATVIDMPRES